MDKEQLHKAATKNAEYFNLTVDPYTGMRKCFIEGAQWLLSQPLCERLTEEEKLSIKIGYDAAVRFMNATINNPCQCEVFKGQKLLLESIFGTDLFTNQPND